MIVYRLCCKEEVEEILEKRSMVTVGKTGKELYEIQKRQNVSNHTYDYQERYLHFFADKASIFYLNVGDNCICTYNLPDEILSSGIGEGYYNDLVNPQRKIKVSEYAIDVNLLSFEYLERVEYVCESLNTNETTLIYNQSGNETRKRKPYNKLIKKGE